MKTALVTITIGDLYSDLGKVTHPTLKRYAEKIGAEFIVWDSHEGHSMPHYQKLELGKLLDSYDRILYIDTDIIIREDAPNLFDIVPESELGIFEEGKFTDRAAGMIQFMKENDYNPNLWDNKYYNTGVMVLSKRHACIFNQPLNEQDHFMEQTYLNLQISKYNVKTCDLFEHKYNHMQCVDKPTGKSRFSSYFIHYAGVNAWMPKDDFLRTVREDLAEWEKSKPEYHYPENIYITVSGGMGDQLAAEPVIRYMRDFLNKGANILIKTDWPELFDHLGLPFHTHGEKIPNAGNYREVYTMSDKDPTWAILHHVLIHCTDFAALQAIKQTLPIMEKTIQLKFDPTHVLSLVSKIGVGIDQYKQGFENSVLVHPGRGWDSKTFPADVWQSYVDALLKSGRTVYVIGKRISKEQGVVEIDTSKCVDLIDKLSLKELIALIAQIPVLISNDSAPIHIAGAFDNHIGLIATCKHPDYILPHRKGSTQYKTRCLEDDQMYHDYFKTAWLINKCDEKRLRKCLPSPDAIVEYVDWAINPTMQRQFF